MTGIILLISGINILNNMEINRVSFTELGFNDITVGTELFKALKISAGDLSETDNISKLKRIAKYLEKHETPINAIRSATMRNNANISNLDYLDNIARADFERREALKQLAKADEELQSYVGTNN